APLAANSRTAVVSSGRIMSEASSPGTAEAYRGGGEHALSPGVVDVDDHQPRRTGRQLDLELVVDAALERRPRQRRVDADVAAPGVGLVRADDAVARQFAAVQPFDLDPGAEVHRLRVGRRRLD